MKNTITLINVSKEYGLYGSPLRQMLGYLGIGAKSIQKKKAIDGVNLKVCQGEKIGVIGHNGSGKTTLLRLITGYTQPTSGEILTAGSIQALMQRGYGFNHELSGIENIRNALVYNGLPLEAIEDAEADIVDFVELGEFLHFPVKTYSLGMRARLEFAAATAIYPDVLVIDEVLGAGDGYFVQKCARRMRQLVENTTLLLVSHSLEQIREYCDRVIWMDGGCLREDGPVELVLDNYRSYMSERSARMLKGNNNSVSRVVGFNLQRQLVAREKLQEMFGLGDDGERIHDFSFAADLGNALVLETGDPLALRMNLTIEKPMRPVVLGLTVHGGFVFEMAAGSELMPGRHEITVRSARLGVGVGNYVLVPALMQSGRCGYLVNGSLQLELQMSATNWSDPPLVHLEGQWFSGDGRTPIDSKVNAWV